MLWSIFIVGEATSRQYPKIMNPILFLLFHSCSFLFLDFLFSSSDMKKISHFHSSLNARRLQEQHGNSPPLLDHSTVHFFYLPTQKNQFSLQIPRKTFFSLLFMVNLKNYVGIT